MPGLAKVMESRPAHLFWWCVLAQVVIWTVVPALVSPNILTDTIEGYAWGHEWPLGTYKHPPLAAWILESFALLTHRAVWAHLLASQLSVAVAFWAVWQTGRRIVHETAALIGALLLTGIGYYNILIPEFNPNVLQLPLWALIGWSFHRAIKDDRLGDWLLFGIFTAAGLYTKYSTVLFTLSLGICMLLNPEARRRLRGKGPWLATLSCVLLLLPHIVWLFQHHFEPFVYAEDRFENSSPPHSLAMLLIWQVAALLPAIIMYVVAFGRKREAINGTRLSFDGMFLLCATFGPFLLVGLIGMIFGVKIRNMWGVPFWNFVGLWAIHAGRPLMTRAGLRRFARIWGAVFVLGILGMAGVALFAPYITHKADRTYFPGKSIAAAVDEAWRARYHTPLRYVVGDIWAAGNVGYYAPDRPHVVVNGDYTLSPWATSDELWRYGGVIVWCRGDCTHEETDDIPAWFWKSEFKDNALRQDALTIPQQTGATVAPVKIGFAFLPPHAMESQK